LKLYFAELEIIGYEFSKLSPYCLDGKITQRSQFIVEGGGYSDIWRGMIGDTLVAIKMLRCFTGGLVKEQIKVKKVRTSLFHSEIGPT